MIPTCLLFVPGDRPERFDKALRSGAGGIVLDLEDAVAPERKASARTTVVEYLRSTPSAGVARFVRINTVRSRMGLEDLLAVAAAGPDGVLLPKTESAGEVAVLAGTLAEAEARTEIVAIVESVVGMEGVEGIARAPGVGALAFGCADLSAELGSAMGWEVLVPYRARLVLAARAAGVATIDGPFLAGDLRDPAAARDEAGRAVALGFDGKLAIHPMQVAAITEAFAPAAEELASAERIVAAAAGGGVAVVDGRMIDAPVVAAARRVIARAGAAPPGS